MVSSLFRKGNLHGSLLFTLDLCLRGKFTACQKGFDHQKWHRIYTFIALADQKHFLVGIRCSTFLRPFLNPKLPSFWVLHGQCAFPLWWLPLPSPLQLPTNKPDFANIVDAVSNNWWWRRRWWETKSTLVNKNLIFVKLSLTGASLHWRRKIILIQNLFQCY